MHNLIISAPFGNYIHPKGTIPTIGTYTLANRGGWWRRMWKILTTVRYHRGLQSWTNNLGLPNPGIDSLKSVSPNAILSICGFSDVEWLKLVHKAITLEVKTIELNLSCPNIDHNFAIPKYAIKYAQSHSIRLIAKLPPIDYMTFIPELTTLGVDWVHLCNTLRTPMGGLSGKLLMQLSLAAVREVRRQNYHCTRIIGGGGITSVTDIQAYLNEGANDVAVGLISINPFKRHQIPKMVEYLKHTGL